MHDDGRRKAEDHHVRPLHPARVHGVAGVGQAGEEALDGPGEAVQGYLDPPGLLLDAQREPGRELMDHSLEDSKIISTADDPAMEEVRREARGGGGLLTVASSISGVVHFLKILNRVHVQTLQEQNFRAAEGFSAGKGIPCDCIKMRSLESRRSISRI